MKKTQVYGHTDSGRPITDTEIEALAAEAEAGYDAEKLLAVAVGSHHVEHREAAVDVGPAPRYKGKPACAQLALQHLAYREKLRELLSPGGRNVALVLPLLDCLALHAEQVGNLARVRI